jgi:hypothetical protein
MVLCNYGIRRRMLKPANTRRRDDESRDEALLSCCVTYRRAGLCRALHRDHGGVEEDLALLMHFRDRVWWQSVDYFQLCQWIAQLMASSRCHGVDWCIRRALAEATA